MRLPNRVGGELQAFLAGVRSGLFTTEMHSSLQVKATSRESDGIVPSLWILLYLSRLLCIFITIFEAHLEWRDGLT